MKRTPGGKAFRAQLVVPEQRQLYDYWLTLAEGDMLPRRASINPSQIARLLPGISLVDVCEPLAQCRVRLAGTRLREAYDREVTGLEVCELNGVDRRSYWIEALERAVRQAEPTQGILQGPMLGKEHVVQYWLKLPLRTAGDGVAMLLCYDYFVPASEMRHLAQAAS